MQAAEKFPGRHLYLGASELGAAVGVNPWRTPLEVYQEKVGAAPPVDLSENEAVLFGNLLEDVVADEFARRQNLKVQRQAAEFVHPRLPWLKGHIDRRIVGRKAGLECKTAGVQMGKAFGEPGSDEVPAHYLIQCMGYLAITGWDEWHLAVLIGGQDFRMYRIPRDEGLIATLEARAMEFWGRVQDINPPDPTTLADTKLLWPRDYGQAIQATEKVESYVRDLLSIKDRLRLAEDQATDLEREIKGFMGDHAILLGADGKPLATWKNNKPSRKFDVELFKAEQPDHYEHYLMERPGPRVFLPKKVKA